MKVLIVDDESITLDFLANALSDDDTEIIVACSSNEAIEKALINKPDLILTDLNMPDKSGLELAAEFKSNPFLSMIPILAVSADDTAKAVKGAFHALVVDYVSKPVDPRYLKRLVRVHSSLHAMSEASKNFQTVVSGVRQEMLKPNIRQRQPFSWSIS